MQRSITLSHSITIMPTSGAHRLRVWVSAYEDMDPYVFVYQRHIPVAGDPTDQDVYSNIASAADMVEYPILAPVGDIPFFRMLQIDLLFRSVDLLNTSFDRMKRDVNSLIYNLDALDIVGVTGSDTFTGADIPDSSSSSSSSSSP